MKIDFKKLALNLAPLLAAVIPAIKQAVEDSRKTPKITNANTLK